MPTPGAELVLRVGDMFDLPKARVLQAALSRVASGAAVCLDFTGVRAFEDAALAVLAVALRGCRGARVAVRGMGGHQLRLMRYLGLRLHARSADGMTGPLA
jgi:anti-anti-sigma regulatory factor